MLYQCVFLKKLRHLKKLFQIFFASIPPCSQHLQMSWYQQDEAVRAKVK